MTRPARPAPPATSGHSWADGRLLAIGVLAAGVAVALLTPRVLPGVGPLTAAVVLGAVTTNTGLVPASARTWLTRATRRLLRIGVVLLGLSLSVTSIAALGPKVLALVVGAVVSTLLLTTWAGCRLGLGHPRSLLIATGFSICGASAVAAMEETAGGDEEDVAIAIAMVTLCGTVAMLVLPWWGGMLPLDDRQYGMWAGACIHEVGQVVGAAGPAGPAALSVAVVVKLTRVLLLGPVVAAVNVWQRRRGPHQAGPDGRPPLVPAFVIGFAVCVAVRSLEVLPTSVLDVAHLLQTVALTAALFGMGLAVHLRQLVRGSGRALALSAGSTVLIAATTLAGVLVLG